MAGEAITSELELLRMLLYRAVRELAFIHAYDNEKSYMISSAEGDSIINEGMKLLGCVDLAEDELPIRMVKA